MVLKKGPAQARWRAGAEVEAVWSMRSNHGGGVQWRLCPANEPLTEACMQRYPLPFVGQQYLLYRNGTRQLLRSKYAVAEYNPAVSPKSEPPGSHGYKLPGTGFYPNGSCPGGYDCPVGATWALNPIPDSCQEGSRGCVTTARSSRTGDERAGGASGPGSDFEFEPPCVGEISVPNAKDRASWRPADLGLCQGERPWHVSIVDVLRVPISLKPGEYVLGFRWDAEETSQVWQSCSDVLVV
eukprot:SAG22_NODE_208_length_15237_cov_22.602774_2_plen_240_part_00